jgi:TonB family protein
VAAAEKAGKKSLDTVEDSDAASENEPGVAPPKLLHAVRAVPPPEAVRQFATGNVILDAVVDTTGRIKSSKVLSGPPSLRNAAADALKQYKYVPAKRHGKPVPAHVQVTVQFWYEP